MTTTNKKKREATTADLQETLNVLADAQGYDGVESIGMKLDAAQRVRNGDFKNAVMPSTQKDEK